MATAAGLPELLDAPRSAFGTTAELSWFLGDISDWHCVDVQVAPEEVAELWRRRRLQAQADRYRLMPEREIASGESMGTVHTVWFIPDPKKRRKCRLRYDPPAGAGETQFLVELA